jgi:hypothetical protein
MRWIWAGVLGLIVAAYALVNTSGALFMAVVAVVYLALYAPLNRWWYVRHNIRINKDGAPGLGSVKLSFDGDELKVEGEDMSTNMKPSAIQRIDTCPSHHFLYIGPVSAIVIPRYAMEVDTLVQAVRGAQAVA